MKKKNRAYDSYCLVVKKNNINVDGEEIEYYSYVSAVIYHGYEKSIYLDNADEEEICAYNIENSDSDNHSYYFSIIDTNHTVQECELIKHDEMYEGAYFRLIDNQFELIDDEEIIEKINESKNLNINKIYKNILNTIKGQDEHIKSILSSIVWNKKLNNSNLSSYDIAKNKHNILLLGKTGTGKTEIIRQISKNINIPMVVVDATNYTEEGYVGKSVDDMLIQLVYAANGDIKEAQKGILVIDEFDKLASVDNRSTVNKEGVQRSLLTLIEGTTKRIKLDGKEQIFNTHGLTIVLLGAFSNIYKEKNIRLIGFNDQGFRENKNNNNIEITKKIVSYGIEPEIVGRLNKIRKLNDLTKQDLINILKSPKGRLMSTLELFKKDNIEIEIDNSYFEEIANLAILDNKGVRSLNRIVDNIIEKDFNELMFGETNKIKIKKLGGN